MLANGDAAIKAAQQSTRTVPVIFIASGDPVADGLVASLAHPGGNITGFAVMEPTLGGKLLDLLKQVAPQVTRVGESRQHYTSANFCIADVRCPKVRR
jgi:putative tryptophan/tyrosine transport system substrate-binding protein